MNKLEIVGGIIGLIYLMTFTLFTLEDSLMLFTILFILLLLLAKTFSKKELSMANTLAASFLVTWLLIKQLGSISLDRWFSKLLSSKFPLLAILTLFAYILIITFFTASKDKRTDYYLQLGISYFILFHYTLFYLGMVEESSLYASSLLLLMVIEVSCLIYAGTKYILKSEESY
ncbi:hypothetical protein [Orenia marismortui]|uniref:hypothetical protein n=1 Tax=Orenia marismortui TaxID=46469 RepID=UPI00035FBCBD|nr:hypothetical protein [Orenia marismortui]